MAMQAGAFRRWLARTAAVTAMGAAALCGVAAGQEPPPPITTGSIVTIPSDNTWGQIYKIAFYKGNALALDTANGALYQLSPGATSWTAIAAPNTGPLPSYSADGMAVDALGTLYLDIRYSVNSSPNALFWRIPYDAAKNTWDFTTSDGWGGNIVDATGKAIVDETGSDDVEFVNSSAMDGSGTLYWMTEASPSTIYSIPVDADGNNDQASVTATTIISGLTADQGKMAVDVNGDIIFNENRATTNADRDDGVYFITAGSTNLVGVNDPSGLVTRLDPGNLVVYGGPTLDANGDIFLTSESNTSYDEPTAGIWEVPNECGGALNVYGSYCYNWNDIDYLGPVAGNNPLAIGPRGYLWIPAYQDWGPAGTGPTPGVWAIVVWAPGALNLGSSPVGTAGAAGTVFVNFNQTETPSALQFSQPGTGSDFAATTTNPNPPSAGTTPAVPCPGGGPYTAESTCLYWVTLNARQPGVISGELSMLDANNNVLAGSTVYLSGTGEGAEAALLNTPAASVLGSGLKNPAQVAVDSVGNTYVADPGLGQVLMFQPGASSGTPLGSGLKAPTGVAVDGSGDVYIGDSGKVIEIPYANGALNTSGQTTLISGLGDHLNLAVDGLGEVYVADEDNSQVLRIPNPAAANYVANANVAGVVPNATPTVGSGFVQPSALAVDTAGDVYVADGSDLYEVTPQGVQTPLSHSLQGPVTGLAVDASGSIYVAQSGGVIRIPSINNSIQVNSAGPVDATADIAGATVNVTTPVGIAMDQQGDLYIADMTNGPTLYDFAVSGSFDYGQVNVGIPQEEDLALFNIGNEPLAVTAAPTFGGADPLDFAYTTATGGTPCDVTGATTTQTGGSCYVGVNAIAAATGSFSGSMALATNAGNVAGGSVGANLQGEAVNDLEQTTTVVTLNPTSTNFPGSTTATVTITPAPTATTPPNTNVPSGPVTLTLTSTAVGTTQQPVVLGPVQASGDDTGTTATFNLKNLQGGPYNVVAQYGGNPSEQFLKSASAPATLTVNAAAPAITLSEPSGITPDAIDGVYYVKQGLTSITLTANVASSLGTPTGTVTFMNGSSVADPTQAALPLDANGNAVFKTGNLPVGTYTITAVYNGDQNFSTVTSEAITFQVIPEAVLLSANPTSMSTTAGTPVAATITMESLVGFAATNGMNISCDNSTLPKDSECTFSVPQPDLCAPTAGSSCTGLTTSVVTLSTNIPVNVSSVPMESSGSPYALAGVFGLGLLGLAVRKKTRAYRRLLGMTCLALLLGSAAMGFMGCTNSGYTHTPPVPVYTTPAGTYQISIVVTNLTSGAQESLPFTMPVTIKAAGSN